MQYIYEVTVFIQYIYIEEIVEICAQNWNEHIFEIVSCYIPCLSGPGIHLF
jgi:hypothetical protein